MGLATGFAILVLLSPVDGAHEKVPLPLPFKAVLDPAHMETSGPALAVGNGFTVTVVIAVLVHPTALVPVTV